MKNKYDVSLSSHVTLLSYSSGTSVTRKCICFINSTSVT